MLDGEDEQAIERLDALIDAFPDEQLGYLAKSRLLLGRGRNEEAAAVAEAGIAAVGQAPALQLIVAQRREAENDFEQAIEIYRGLYESNPDSVLYANNLVSLLAEHREDDAESIAFAKRVARRLRGYDVPHLQDTYGWVQFLAGDYDEALRSLQPAAEGLPDNPLVRYHLGRTYAEIGEVASAREHLEAALALDPDFPKATSAREALAGLETATPGQ